jgi:hypothetical protein
MGSPQQCAQYRWLVLMSTPVDAERRYAPIADRPDRAFRDRQKGNITMPVPSHTKAAEHDTNAAAEHKAAADLHSKGQHAAALEKSNKALGTGVAAQKASTDAHGKSLAHAKK